MLRRVLFVVWVVSLSVWVWPAAAAATAPLVQSASDWDYFLSQPLSPSLSEDLAIGDLDGDGDLDAVIANAAGQPDQVWINLGGVQGGSAGQFGPGALLCCYDSRAVALGDVDGDGDLDAFVVHENQSNRLWLNDGAANFSDSGQELGAAPGRDVALGDLDGDGDLDALVVNDGFSWIWSNSGGGVFVSQELPVAYSRAVALGDLNGDSALDAFFAFYGEGSQVWLNANDGTGSLFNSGPAYYASGTSTDVALGDMDGDGDLDAVVATEGANELWLNSGSGTFVPGPPTLGVDLSSGVALGDVDLDGDLDAVIANDAGLPNPVLLNNGSGVFMNSGRIVGALSTRAVAVGDLNGDGTLDAMVANYDQPGEVWLMSGDPTSIALSGMTVSTNPNWALPAVVLLGMVTLLLAWRRLPRRR